jgi:hypothetical protein
MSFRLFVDSSNGVTLDVEYDYADLRSKIENKHRTRDGSQYTYKWSAWDKLSFSIMYVNSSTKALVNSWWESNTDLLFKDENATEVFSVHLSNDSLPISKFVKPYTSLWKGVIELEGY